MRFPVLWDMRPRHIDEGFVLLGEHSAFTLSFYLASWSLQKTAVLSLETVGTTYDQHAVTSQKTGIVNCAAVKNLKTRSISRFSCLQFVYYLTAYFYITQIGQERGQLSMCSDQATGWMKGGSILGRGKKFSSFFKAFIPILRLRKSPIHCETDVISFGSTATEACS